jgi:hypothetical protein
VHAGRGERAVTGHGDKSFQFPQHTHRHRN